MVRWVSAVCLSASLALAAAPGGYQTDGPGTAFPSLAGGVMRQVPQAPSSAPVLVVPQMPPEPRAPAMPIPASPAPDEWAPLPAAETPIPAPQPQTTVEVIAPPRVQEAPVEAQVTAVDPQAQLVRRARTRGPAVVASAPAVLPEVVTVLERAREAVAAHRCGEFQQALDAIAQQQPRSMKTEAARVLAARCSASELRVADALTHYRRYLDEYPQGTFAAEARAAVGE